MASDGHSAVYSQKTSHRFARALSSAFFEWLLIFMLLIDSVVSYLITKFARNCKLQTPCLLCSRLDHVLGKEKQKFYWDLLCGVHKLEISSLVYCRSHNKLVDVHGMCESCLFSFATINKSNAETYRLLVGKLGEDTDFGNEGHKVEHSSIRHCSCCNEPWIPKGYVKTLIPTQSTMSQAAEFDLPLSVPVECGQDNASVSVKATDRKRIGSDHLSCVVYKELKVSSDSESEVSGDAGDEEDVHNFQTDHLKRDIVDQHVLTECGTINMLDDFAMEILVDPVSAFKSSNFISESQPDIIVPLGTKSVDSTDASGNGFKELNWKQASNKTTESSAIPELISPDDVSFTSNGREASVNFSTEMNANSTDKVPPLSNASEILNQGFDDHMSSSSIVNQTPVEVSKESKPVSVDDVSPSNFVTLSVKESKELECCTTNMLDEFAMEKLVDPVPASKPSAVISESQPDIIVPLGTKSVDSTDSRLNCLEEHSNETEPSAIPELISLDDVPFSSNGREASFDVSTDVNVNSVGKVPPLSNAGEIANQGFDDHMSPSSHGNQTPVEVSKESKSVSIDDVSPSDFVTFSVEESKEICVTRTLEVKQKSVTECEEIRTTREKLPPVPESPVETNRVASETSIQVNGSLDLSDAYNLAVGSRGRQLSGLLVEQWIGKDSSRVSEDLKALLSQLSAARGTEQSMNDVSPRISVNSDELKTSDASSLHGMQILQKRISLERNESGLSLDGSIVSEIEGETVVDRLKRQVEHDRKLLHALYKELEEERNASAIAANQAMAMITRLQEEKATLQMEALQNLRMMEEQAEYDMEALQNTNDLLAEKEKEILGLEAELEFYRMKLSNDLKARKGSVDHSEINGIEEKESMHTYPAKEKPNICCTVKETDQSFMDTNKGTNLSEFDPGYHEELIA